jgi:hypothetical protein
MLEVGRVVVIPKRIETSGTRPFQAVSKIKSWDGAFHASHLKSWHAGQNVPKTWDVHFGAQGKVLRASRRTPTIPQCGNGMRARIGLLGSFSTSP